MSTLSERLREATRDVVTGEKLLPGVFGHAPIEDLAEAADELDRLTAELEQHKKSAAFCDSHQPKGGQRGLCLVCTCQNLSAAMSRISYLCGPPNEMQCGPYDIHCDETAVVVQVERLTARVAELEDRLFAYGAMDDPPCFCCGYNGPGYFQPDKHPCAKRHHAALESKHE